MIDSTIKNFVTHIIKSHVRVSDSEGFEIFKIIFPILSKIPVEEFSNNINITDFEKITCNDLPIFLNQIDSIQNKYMINIHHYWKIFPIHCNKNLLIIQDISIETCTGYMSDAYISTNLKYLKMEELSFNEAAGLLLDRIKL